jgi:predicted nucleotidyltransferase
MRTTAEGLGEICRRYGIGALYLFGSRAPEMGARLQGGDPPPAFPGSDLDVGVLLPRGAMLDHRRRVALASEIEDLFGVDRADLVLLNEASAFLALEAVRGDLVYDSDPDHTARFEMYVLRRAADLLPFERQRRELVLRQGAS